MPWFYPELDDDLQQALDRLGLHGGSALDLGTGPGTQAMQLARRGFDVTAADISEAAIRLAREKAEEQKLAITWQQDDVLATRLSGPFDLIFDRGCFHVLPPERRPDYVSTVAELLKVDGYLFLKCFSHLQPGAQGPHRFARAHHYFEAGKAEAARRGVACNWRLVPDAGIGHDGAAMSRVAAALWFENRLMTAEEAGAAPAGAL